MLTERPEAIEVQVAARGLITLPHALREAYGIRQGDRLTLLDLGGVFVLSPHASRVDALAERAAEQLRERGETVESMLLAIREERARYEP
jgi:bifunctional DNA-binding transcriptional regulator/antitoxin component of YhaV-PrlF toxin-antitoxin module